MTSTIYFNKKTGYGANHPILTRTYDSIGEAALAEALDIVWTDGYLIDVVPQPKFSLFKDGKKVCVHIPDFLITLPDYHKEIREFKGNYDGELLEKWLEKLKLWPANYPNIPYLVVPEKRLAQAATKSPRTSQRLVRSLKTPPDSQFRSAQEKARKSFLRLKPHPANKALLRSPSFPFK